MDKTYIPYLVMAVALIFMIRRNLSSRRIQASTLWVFPVLLVVIAGLSIVQSPPRDTFGVAVVTAAALAGAVAGWYRGKLTNITLDPETGALTGKGSVIGLAIILGLYIARYAIVTWAKTHPDHAGTAVIVADSALLFGFATLIVSRLEMWVRCRKLMAGAAAA
jgi:hypothetical protein